MIANVCCITQTSQHGTSACDLAIAVMPTTISQALLRDRRSYRELVTKHLIHRHCVISGPNTTGRNKFLSVRLTYPTAWKRSPIFNERPSPHLPEQSLRLERSEHQPSNCATDFSKPASDLGGAVCRRRGNVCDRVGSGRSTAAGSRRRPFSQSLDRARQGRRRRRSESVTYDETEWCQQDGRSVQDSDAPLGEQRPDQVVGC
jgi:hypothetical protein